MNEIDEKNHSGERLSIIYDVAFSQSCINITMSMYKVNLYMLKSLYPSAVLLSALQHIKSSHTIYDCDANNLKITITFSNREKDTDKAPMKVS